MVQKMSLPGFGIGMALANFQIDGMSPASQMSFIRSKTAWSEDSGRSLRSW